MLRGTSGAGLVKFQATSPSASPASTTLRVVRIGWLAARTARRASLNGVSLSSATPRAASSAEEGEGCGTQSRSGSIGSGTGFTSKRTVAMSTPETPSTRAWWVFVTSAKRFFSSPWTSQSSQSGLERSSPWEKSRPAMLRSCSSEPGAGSAEWRTW